MYEHVKTGCKHISPSEQPLQFQSGYCLNTPLCQEISCVQLNVLLGCQNILSYDFGTISVTVFGFQLKRYSNTVRPTCIYPDFQWERSCFVSLLSSLKENSSSLILYHVHSSYVLYSGGLGFKYRPGGPLYCWSSWGYHWSFLTQGH